MAAHTNDTVSRGVRLPRRVVAAEPCAIRRTRVACRFTGAHHAHRPCFPPLGEVCQPERNLRANPYCHNYRAASCATIVVTVRGGVVIVTIIIVRNIVTP